MQNHTEQLRIEVVDQLRQLDWFRRGSLLLVHNRCGNRSCRCRAEPPQLHGPYWQWTWKAQGKTITRRLRPDQVDLVRQWISNAHQLDQLIAQLDRLSIAVTDAILAGSDSNSA